MSVDVRAPSAARPALATPEGLRDFMGTSHALSDEQFAAVTAPLEPGVVIAGAGSGKTTVMAARVVWLVGTGQVRPDEVLGLTFTTKAAAELASRVREALTRAGALAAPPGEEPVEPTVATYHAYAASLLTEHGLRIGHEPDTRVVADASRHQLAAKVIDRHTRPVRLLSDHPPTVSANLLALDAQLSEHLATPDDVRRFHAGLRGRLEEALPAEPLKGHRDVLAGCLNAMDRREELLHLVEEYRALKRSLGLMEFADQIELAARLVTECPEVGAEERRRFRVVLLDEYQDTSVAQALLLSRLFSGPDPEHGRGHPVTAVGDPHQAIYGWRGASASNILRFGETFPRADDSGEVPVLTMTINRRSDSRILALANRVVQPLAERGGSVARLRPAPGAPPGRVRAEVFETYDEELRWLAHEVAAAHDRHGRWDQIAVLTRDNAHAADVFDALAEAEIPVEIVGLKGLLALPEVFEVVAMLTLVHDLAANAHLLAVLSGPRWAIGPRDLALLGERAAELAGARPGRREASRPLRTQLADAVDNVDPTEVPALAEAVADPGDGDYSAEARERFALVADELRRLRAHAGEPLLDLVRRIIDVTGLEVDLASSTSPAAAARRDNLDLFVRAVADFQAVDGEASLPALLAYLEAEDAESGTGLDVATPTEADSVKLLTTHRAKGLEWDAVFVVGVARHKFPSSRGRAKWTSAPAVLPYPLRGDRLDLPDWVGTSKQDHAAFVQACRDHEAAEELRLAYVAFTRPRHELAVSSYVWGPTRKDACGPSDYQVTVREFLEELAQRGELDEPLPTWPEVPDKGTPNPLLATPVEVPWPRSDRTEEARRRREAASRVRALMQAPEDAEPAVPTGLTAEEQARVAAWDEDLDRLLREADARAAAQVEVELPSSLSATTLGALAEDPDELAARLARPMPRRPSPAARRGTRFHAWVQAQVAAPALGLQEALLDPDDLAGRADLGVDDDAELAELQRCFLAGPFAGRSDAEVEVPFALVLGSQVVRGRIDAVFPAADGGVLLVDWKTSKQHDADPLQLAVYRLAWSEMRGVPLERVRAAFCYVRDGVVDEPRGLPGRPELERLLGGSGSDSP